MRHYFIPLLFLILLGCAKNTQQGNTSNSYPNIFPDYINTVIPPNIAPLNFRFNRTTCENLEVTISDGENTITCNGKTKITIPAKKWRTLLQANKGKKLTVTVSAQENGEWTQYKSFTWKVAKEEIDPYLAYRLIAPGYEAWGEMGIYQRHLESFEEKPLYVNTLDQYSCINCHAFCNQDPNTFAFHSRVNHSGTYLTQNGKTERLNMKNDRVFGASRYPIWHPSGKYMAFSINDTKQFFHSKDKNRVEVYDKASDIVIYDTEKKAYITPAHLMRPEAFETFPAFSPDGETLYFCTCDSVNMPTHYAQAQYSLCKTNFDPSTGNVGTQIDTLFNAVQKKKVLPCHAFHPMENG